MEPTTCAIVNRAQFRDFIVANPDFAQHLIQHADPPRARSATENVKSLALSDVYGRLVRLLNALAVEHGRQHRRATSASRSRTSPTASARRAT